MRLYRTCAPKLANIEHFLSGPEEIQAIQELVPTQNMIDEVFLRKPSSHSSRFCPPWFEPIPLYASENEVTTFYEYCFHLLSNKRFFFGNKAVSASLYYLDLKGRPKAKDITKKSPPGVMNKSSYARAHMFIKKLRPFPELIKYRSVRDKARSINCALYSRRFIKIAGLDPTQLIISFVNSRTVEITIGTKFLQISPGF